MLNLQQLIDNALQEIDTQYQAGDIDGQERWNARAHYLNMYDMQMYYDSTLGKI